MGTTGGRGRWSQACHRSIHRARRCCRCGRERWGRQRPAQAAGRDRGRGQSRPLPVARREPERQCSAVPVCCGHGLHPLSRRGLTSDWPQAARVLLASHRVMSLCPSALVGTASSRARYHMTDMSRYLLSPLDIARTWSTWSAVGNRTHRAGELSSAPSGPDDWHRATGKRDTVHSGIYGLQKFLRTYTPQFSHMCCISFFATMCCCLKCRWRRGAAAASIGHELEQASYENSYACTQQ